MADEKQQSEKTATRSQDVEVTLKKDHSHAGRDFKAGEKITVPKAHAEWLAGQGIA